MCRSRARSTSPLPSEAESTDPLSLFDSSTYRLKAATERVPLEFHWYGGGDDAYYMPGTLAMRPAFGFPLAEGEQYCALVTRAVSDAQGGTLAPSDDFLAAWESEPTLSALISWLTESPLHRQDIAVATCFTTQRATDELRRVRAYLDTVEMPVVDYVFEPALYGRFHGTYGAELSVGR